MEKIKRITVVYKSHSYSDPFVLLFLFDVNHNTMVFSVDITISWKKNYKILNITLKVVINDIFVFYYNRIQYVIIDKESTCTKCQKLKRM